MRPLLERLLVTVDEATGPLWAVRALRRAGYVPWVAVDEPGTYSSRSRAAEGVVEVPDPRRERDAFVSQLAAAAEALGVAAVIPASENTLTALAGAQESFPASAIVASPSAEQVARATDKLALPALAAGAGIATPPSEILSGTELRARAASFDYPLVVKPERSVSTVDGHLRSNQTRRLGDAEALLGWADESDDRYVVQPHISGQLYAVGSVTWRGELVCAMHQVSPRIFPPGSGGTSFAVTVAPDASVETAVGRLATLLDWSGILQVQFIRAANGLFVIDVNPRVYGSIGLAVAAGMNLPAIWVDLLLGREPRIAGYRAGVGYRVEEDDYRVLLRDLASGRRGAALRGLLPRRRTSHAVFSLRDPGPSLTTLSKLARKRS